MKQRTEPTVDDLIRWGPTLTLAWLIELERADRADPRFDRDGLRGVASIMLIDRMPAGRTGLRESSRGRL